MACSWDFAFWILGDFLLLTLQTLSPPQFFSQNMENSVLGGIPHWPLENTNADSDPLLFFFFFLLCVALFSLLHEGVTLVQVKSRPKIVTLHKL